MTIIEKVISVYDAAAAPIKNGVDAAREHADADTYGEVVAEPTPRQRFCIDLLRNITYLI